MPSPRGLAILAVLSAATLARGSEQADDLVWTWFTKCAEPRQIALEVEVDGRVIHTSQFPACLAHRAANDGRQIAFPLSAKKSHFGETPGTALEVNVWEAGAEAKGMILGVSFMSPQRVWLNTLHFAEVDRPSASKLARGIVVKTYPVKSAKAS